MINMGVAGTKLTSLCAKYDWKKWINAPKKKIRTDEGGDKIYPQSM